jgi:hypothetical protein
MIYVLLLPALLLVACDTKRVASLRAENDSLRGELVSYHKVMAMMRDVNCLLDSIDVCRHALQPEMPHEQITLCLQRIHEYMYRSEVKVATIERSLQASQRRSSAYTRMLEALKHSLTQRDNEVQNLEVKAETYRRGTHDLLYHVRQREEAVNVLYEQMAAQSRELVELQNLALQFRLTEAETCYARAQAAEGSARRMKMAPAKKRDAFKAALNLYRKALLLGKDEAQQHIAALEATQ